MLGQELIIGRTAGDVLIPVQVDSLGRLYINAIASALPPGSSLIGAVGIEGFYNSAWRKAPIPWGASADYGLNWQNLNLPAGASNQDGAALPANAFTVITSWSVKYVGTVTNVILDLIRMDGGTGGTARNIITYMAPRSGLFQCWNGFFVCKSSDILRVAVAGATLNDDLYSSVNGYYLTLNL